MPQTFPTGTNFFFVCGRGNVCGKEMAAGTCLSCAEGRQQPSESDHDEEKPIEDRFSDPSKCWKGNKWRRSTWALACRSRLHFLSPCDGQSAATDDSRQDPDRHTGRNQERNADGTIGLPTGADRVPHFFSHFFLFCGRDGRCPQKSGRERRNNIWAAINARPRCISLSSSS